MLTLMELFLGVESALTKQEQPLLPIHVTPPPSPPKEKAGIMEAARLPVDRFLIYAEEGDGASPTAITVKK